MLDKVARGKHVDLESYLDRDMPVLSEKLKKKYSTGALPSDKAQSETEEAKNQRAIVKDDTL